MLASGGDEGVLKVWDLRTFADGKHLANFAHHRCGWPWHVTAMWSFSACMSIASTVLIAWGNMPHAEVFVLHGKDCTCQADGHSGLVQTLLKCFHPHRFTSNPRYQADCEDELDGT